MDRYTKVLLVAGSFAALPWISALGGDVKVNAGVSYRSFGSVEFGTVTLQNSDPSQVDSSLLHGVQSYTGADVTGLPKGLAVIPGTFVSYPGEDADVGSGDALAPVIGFELALPWVLTEQLSLSLVGNVQYYSISSSSFASGNKDGNGGLNVQRYLYAKDPLAGSVILDSPFLGPTSNFIGNESAYVRNTFDMDLFVLDLGLKAAHKLGDKTPVDVYVAFGPSLSIAGVDSSQSEGATWDQIPGASTPGYTKNLSRSETDFLPGVYGALGASVKLSEHWGVAAEYRYDEVFEKAGASQATLDLSGSSGQVKVFYQF